MKKTYAKLLSYKIAIAVLGVLAIGSIGAYAYDKPLPETIKDFILVEGDFIQAPEPAPEPELGATPGPIQTDPYQSVGGVETYTYRVKINTASTTWCAIKSPTATSVLSFWSLGITTGTGTAQTVVAARSNTAFATTTQLSTTMLLGVGSGGMFVGSSTTEMDSGLLFKGSTSATVEQYFVVSANGSNGAAPYSATGITYSGMVGYCQAIFTVIQ